MDADEAISHTKPFWLTEDQIEIIAERAALKATKKITDNFYREVGHQIVKKILYGIGSIGLLGYLIVKGYISLKFGGEK